MFRCAEDAASLWLDEYDNHLLPCLYKALHLGACVSVSLLARSVQVVSSSL